MYEENYYSQSENQEDMDNQQPMVYNIDIDNEHKNSKELTKFFNEAEMGGDDLIEMILDNNIALNLYQSLNKLKKGSNQKFNDFCQIKVYPKLKLMVIYIVVSFNFLRIKAELADLKENPKFKKNVPSEIKKNSNSNDSQEESQIFIEEKKEREIIFTLKLINLYSLFEVLLCENKDNPILLTIDNNFSYIKGKGVYPDEFNQIISGNTWYYSLIKNENFKYAINPPKENNEIKEKTNSKNSINEFQDEKNSNLSDINIINDIQSKSDIISEEESDYLEKKFQTNEQWAKYMIEGSDLLELYHLMKGVESYYSDSMQGIGISMTNDKALFFCLDYDKITNFKSFDKLSKCIKHMTLISIKCVKDHRITPFTHGFNSFFRLSLLSKFITSFYNKEDKRLLVKVSPFGKMILSYTFSDPKSEINKMSNEGIGISTEINANLDENKDSEKSNNRKKIIKDSLLYDEYGGNIVEMIFYPNVFDLCKK